MKFHPSNLIQLALGFIVLLITSCNKDSDLLAEYVVENPEVALMDNVVTLRNSSVIIRPSKRDSNGKSKKTTITDVSSPSIGTAVINEDNSITYTPDTDITGTDEFSYTTDVTNTDDTITQETGSITVTITDKTPIPTEPLDMGELKAFPSAHGFGRYATGGRGGKVVPVTNLNDSGEGSLRAALTASGARTIVFRVSGTINLSSYISVNNPNFTIAGETAPGQGIQIDGSGGIQIQASNFIIRHIRFRGSDIISNVRIISSGGQEVTNGIIDHCSFSLPYIEEMNIAFETSSSRLHVKDITVQNSILGEATRGIILYKGPHNISIYRNLFVNIQQRCILSNYPEYAPINALTFEEINNIIHNTQVEAIQASYGTKLVAIGNERSNSQSSRFTVNSLVDLYSGGEWTHSNSHVYVNDNINRVGEIYDSGTGSYVKSSPFATSDIVGDNIIPAENLSSILPTIGAFYWDRDDMDTRYINDYTNNTGSIGTYIGTPPALKVASPYTDSDGDGMSDDWEKGRGLNPNSADNNGDDDNDGYTNLEEFLHTLARDN
eukprot:TRINITY_DN17871_c0_g1_i1.p1 TRINITY_DN17871_c0_g1~~TRINITY_DN17871_c0_g1_i1.p1  ORF type:complete len:551 (-),score=62.01 TRINITY_DN17871_c0_g1_i1:532-2184(-)